MDSLEHKLGYRFQDARLLVEALTHASKRHESGSTLIDNQRLEFLGDAVLQLIFTRELFHRFKDFQEGLLTKLRIRLVSRKALASFANKLQLGQHLEMGKGEIATGGQNRSSNLADAFEALIGAIYLDGGMQQACRVVLELAHDEIEELGKHPEEDNPKGELQEILQGVSHHSPHYKVIGYEGPDHSRTFTAQVTWETQVLGEGRGPSKKEAAIEAARNALENPILENLDLLASLDQHQVENKPGNRM